MTIAYSRSHISFCKLHILLRTHSKLKFNFTKSLHKPRLNTNESLSQSMAEIRCCDSLSSIQESVSKEIEAKIRDLEKQLKENNKSNSLNQESLRQRNNIFLVLSFFIHSASLLYETEKIIKTMRQFNLILSQTPDRLHKSNLSK